VNISSVLTDAERSSLGAKPPSNRASETPLGLVSLSSTGTTLRLHRGVIVVKFIVDFTPSAYWYSLPQPTRLHLGSLCPSRLSSCYYEPASIAPSTPSLIPSLPIISAQSVPSAAKTTSNTPLRVLTAPHTFAGTITRSLPARHDSSAPPKALFSSGIRSTGTREGNYAE
jgi:hypothetical protein